MALAAAPLSPRLTLDRICGRGEVGARALPLRGAELRWVATALHNAGHRLTAAAKAASPHPPPAPCAPHAPSPASARLHALAEAPLRSAARAALAAALSARVTGGGHQVRSWHLECTSESGTCVMSNAACHAVAPAEKLQVSEAPLQRMKAQRQNLHACAHVLLRWALLCIMPRISGILSMLTCLSAGSAGGSTGCGSQVGGACRGPALPGACTTPRAACGLHPRQPPRCAAPASAPAASA